MLQSRRITSSPLFKYLKVLFIGLTAFLLAFLFSLVDLSNNLELLSLDTLFRLRPAIKQSEDILLINLDDEALNQYGSWPWSRYYQVVLLQTLSRYKTGPLIFDVLFSEPEPSVIIPSGDPNAKKQPHAHKGIINYDKAFADAIRQQGLVFIAYFAIDPSARLKRQHVASETERLRQLFPEPKRQAVSYIESTLLKTPPHVTPFIYKSVDIEPPLLELLKASRGFGFAQPGYSSDGTIRNFIAFRQYNDLVLNPIVLATFAELKGIDLKDRIILPGKEVRFKYVRQDQSSSPKELSIPIDHHLQALLNWPGSFKDSFTHISFRDISYVYAFQQAMDIASRAFNEGIVDPKRVKGLITKNPDINKLLHHQEAETLAAEAVAATWIARHIKKGDSGGYLKVLTADVIDPKRLEQVAFSVKTALKAETLLKNNQMASIEEFTKGSGGHGAEDTETAAIFNDVKRTLETGHPNYYYFPRIEALREGIKVSMSPFDLAGKIILIGLTGEGTIDLSPTPFESQCPMVFYHASALNMLINEDFLHYPPKGLGYLTALLLALTASLIAIRYSVTLLTAFTLSSITLYLLTMYYLWVYEGQWIEVVLPLMALLLAYLIALVLQFIKVYRDKSKTRALFSAMVSPAVLALMERHPESFSLTGQRRHATTYFSKIEGIDAVTSSLTPEGLPVFLSSYLTPMSNIIMHYDGYIDKYEGVVIMADFGVPLEDKGNVFKCAYAALEQMRFANAYGHALNERYGASIRLSIGFNSGYVSAGNMGSDRKFQYTVMGDAVNMAARFMAANYIYRSNHPLTGEDTFSLLRDYVYARPLDKLLLKGKTIPTKIYDILGWKSEAYRELMKGKPVPDFLEALWSSALSESIDFLAHFWQGQYERTDLPLAQGIASFFNEHTNAAGDWMIYEFALDLKGMERDIASLAKRVGYPSKVNAEHEDLQSILASLEAELVNLKGFIDSQPGHDSIHPMFEALDNRLGLLRERRDRHVMQHKNSLALIESLLPYPVEHIQETLSRKRHKYRSATEAFIKTLKAQDYHELLSRVGEPDNKEAIGIYEQGLGLYWQRRWDEALGYFHRASSIDPKDHPPREMIQRIEGFKETPPPEGWQGEFIQVKK